MVRLVNLDEDGESEAGPPNYPTLDAIVVNETEEPRPNPNLNSCSAALSCYPIVSQLCAYLDLVTLSELARTCRQVRANLLQHRSILIKQTLRCENERVNPAQRLGEALVASRDAWTAYSSQGPSRSRITGGRIGACARDMVGDCRKCGRIVCRNCTVKAPPMHLLKLRYRRLCRTCMKSPLDNLTVVSRVVETDDSNDEEHSAETRTFARSPCNCEQDIWICQSCSHHMRADDTTYLRGWTWRSRYAKCGGLGAGLGEGNEGVQCGRTSHCLAAKLVLKDVECDAAELESLQADAAKAEIQGRHWNGGSYLTAEMVGVGGKIKTKAKKLVPVGAVVKEYEDERESLDFLGREQSGANRTWCSWCDRVVEGKKDKERAGRSTDSIVSCSSSSDA